MGEVIQSSSTDSKNEVVLIVTDETGDVTEVAEFLKRKSYEVKIARFDGTKLKNTPKRAPSAVLCAFDGPIKQVERLVAALRTKFEPISIPFIGAVDRTYKDLDCFDSLIFPPAHPVQIANRVNSMVRLGIMQSEIALRMDTLQEDFETEFDLSEMSFEDPFRVLFIGKATPEFMVVINALQNKNVEVVAAFTSFSAFDFLHEHVFDAVVMNALNSIEPALTISETMRRNAKLFHVPTLFLIGDHFTSHDLAYQKGATDIISTDCTEDQISGRILELANYHRIHRQLKQEFEKIGQNQCFDAGTNTYSEAFFKAHLNRATSYYPTQSTPVSLMTIKVSPISDVTVLPDALQVAQDEAGRMIRTMVRIQDATGRLNDHQFAIMFPGQEASRLGTVIDRLFNVMDCTAFDTGLPEGGTFRFKLDINLTQLLPDERADAFLSRTLSPETEDDIQLDADISELDVTSFIDLEEEAPLKRQLSG